MEKNENFNELNNKLEKIQKDMNNLNTRILRLEKNKGDRNLKEFKITKKEEWEVVERNLIKEGIVLEFDILSKIDKLRKEYPVQYSNNESFKYPKDEGTFFYDYLFNLKDPFFYTELKYQNIAEFERDILLEYSFQTKIESNNFEINLHFCIECKARSNPPINYLIIEDNYCDLEKKNNFKSILELENYPSLFKFGIKSSILSRTEKKIIAISYPNFDIDKMETFVEAFWQLIRSIDELSSEKFIEHIRDKEFDSIKNIMDETIPLDVYIPIIVVNGNLYGYTYDSNNQFNLGEVCKPIEGCVREFSLLKMGNKYTKYNHISNIFLRNTKKIQNLKFKPLSQLEDQKLSVIILTQNSFYTQIKNLIDDIQKTIPNQLNDILLDKVWEIDNEDNNQFEKKRKSDKITLLNQFKSFNYKDIMEQWEEYRRWYLNSKGVE